MRRWIGVVAGALLVAGCGLAYGTEVRTSTSIARSAGDLHAVFADDARPRGEAILVDGSAAARLAGAEWEVMDAEVVRLFENLSTALVIADLGAEPNGTGYRLLLERGFDSYPQAVSGSLERTEQVTEIVVDTDGRPISATFHRWSPFAEAGCAEGIAAYTFADVGALVELPPFPIEPASEAPTTPSPEPLIPTALPFADLSVDLPASHEEGVNDLTSRNGRAPGARARRRRPAGSSACDGRRQYARRRPAGTPEGNGRRRRGTGVRRRWP